MPRSRVAHTGRVRVDSTGASLAAQPPPPSTTVLVNEVTSSKQRRVRYSGLKSLLLAHGVQESSVSSGTTPRVPSSSGSQASGGSRKRSLPQQKVRPSKKPKKVETVDQRAARKKAESGARKQVRHTKKMARHYLDVLNAGGSLEDPSLANLPAVGAPPIAVEHPVQTVPPTHELVVRHHYGPVQGPPLSAASDLLGPVQGPLSHSNVSIAPKPTVVLGPVQGPLSLVSVIPGLHVMPLPSGPPRPHLCQ
jgi:hypothetical protein